MAPPPSLAVHLQPTPQSPIRRALRRAMQRAEQFTAMDPSRSARAAWWGTSYHPETKGRRRAMPRAVVFLCQVLPRCWLPLRSRAITRKVARAVRVVDSATRAETGLAAV